MINFKNKVLFAAASFFVVFSARAETILLVAPKIQIEVRDPALVKKFQNPLKINFGVDEKAILKGYKGKAQDKIKLLVFDLKDLIDEKAGPVDELKKVSDLTKEQRDEIAMLGDLREQLALNWLETEVLAQLKNQPNKELSFELLNKRLLEEFFFTVNEATLRSFYCHKDSKFKVVDCQANKAP